MALTGLEIFKLLPKKNCKECGQPTCLAFAMALASAKTTLEKCPYVSEEAKETLGGAAAPPIRLVSVGTGDKKRDMGDEVVLFRHDKAFYHPACIAVEIPDTLKGADLDARIARVSGLGMERVGQKVNIDLAAVSNQSGNALDFAECAARVDAASGLAMVLISSDPVAMGMALDRCAASKPLIYAATEANADAMTELAKKYGCPLAVKGNGLESTALLAEKIGATCKELVLDLGTEDLSQLLAELTQVRRLAIKKKFRPFGYPVMTFARGETEMDQIVDASAKMSKYASLIVTSVNDRAMLLPLMAWRMNLYTDPQKPSQVEPGVYAVGAAGPNSPVFVTTNFSLTYYTVEGEISATRIPAYIIACPTDGTSVLTAWAAGKFTGDKIAEFLKSCGVEEKVTHRNLVIPGYVAVLKGALEEKSGWKILVGPQEASGLSSYMKSNFL
ncbi:MAG TPA: acetyl-CoA decarbonylase/synthase complex subunit gamma [Clostridiales bacterium]|nr:acetyl-CoA decarbonylase/synthase complex subunit gamma [Clostridiales bacterium]